MVALSLFRPGIGRSSYCLLLTVLFVVGGGIVGDKVFYILDDRLDGPIRCGLSVLHGLFFTCDTRA
jgi:hypothetical protein